MTNKILKKYTTIPQHLYVERAADRQLRDIIEEMQRPGYVLVARQMGKTNLLFNAKRNLESNSRKFVYIDLSNNFETERECYNYIIDSVLDVLDEELWEIRSDIEIIRTKTRTDHISYTKSLSKILKSLDKDLILILDEIDALRTSDYSDNIFAVIRSNYFTRSNFSEFEHLTYILSGVIEPKDLIKDRNKSPFNIGEKIYLEDFSHAEFVQFIEKSKLGLDEKLVDYIYSWTSGNPRLSFDVCSDVEALLISGSSITTESIKQLIKNKYLTSYDIAPIDHIRELVSENQSIQDAIFQLVSGDKLSMNISDAIKNKLYLYGIISSGKNDTEPKIKNRILQESLGIDWLKSLSIEDPQIIIDKAMNLVNQSHDYHKAIELLADVILIESIEPFKLSLALYYLAFSERNIKKFESSNEHFLQQPFTQETTPLLHFRQKLFTGLNYYDLGEYDAGNFELQYVIDNDKNSLTWAHAAITLAVREHDQSKSAVLLLKITAMEDGSNNESRDVIRTIKSHAYYRLSRFPTDIIGMLALEYVNSALSIGIPNHIPFILLQRLVLTDENKTETIEEIVQHVIDKQLSFSVDAQEQHLIEYNEVLHYALLAYCFSGSYDFFELLLKYSSQNLNLSDEDIFENTVDNLSNEKDKHSFIKIYIDKHPDDASLTLRRYFTKSSIAIKKLDHKQARLYLNILMDISVIESQDIVAIAYMLKQCAEEGDPQKGIEYAEMVKHLFFGLEDTLRYESSVFYYWQLLCYVELQISEPISELGREVLERLETPYTGEIIIDEEGEKIIRKNVLDKLSASRPVIKSPFRKSKSYERNQKIKVKYIDGRVVKNKFKKLESDILSLKCEIIE